MPSEHAGGARATATVRCVRPSGPTELVLRRVEPDADDELRDVVALAGRALGWRAGEPNEELFRWKHRANPFGPSPMWVAEVGGTLAGFRTLMRWQWVSAAGEVLHAVRAVDTATDPAFQGRGIFRALTLHAVRELVADGADFVFNTPNDQSRPGYLRMGWQQLGRVPVAAAPSGPAGVLRMAQARTAAGKWSVDLPLGLPAAEVTADAELLGRLLASQPVPDGLRTDRTPAFLRWRYAGGPLTYRAFVTDEGPAGGIAFFRCRRRGRATELTLCDVVVPGGDRSRSRGLVRSLRAAARATGVDYLVAVQRPLLGSCGVRLPRQGPILTWRPLCRQEAPRLQTWDLRLGDVELF